MSYAFVFGPPKSGTTLLAALLDGHPALSVLPFELQYYKLCCPSLALVQAQINLRKYRQAPTIYEGANRLTVDVIRKTEFDRLQMLDDAERAANRDRFERIVQGLENMETAAIGDAREYFDRVFRLYEELAGDASKDVTRIEKTPFNEFRLSRIEKDFGAQKYIYVVRNPIANMAALHVRRKRFNGRSCLGFLYYLSALRKSYSLALKLLREMPDRLMLVSFDLLLVDSEKCMKQVAGFLGVEYLPDMLKPTILGHSWGGNSMYDKEFSQIDKAPLTHWRQAMNPCGYRLVRAVLYGPYRKLIRERLGPDEWNSIEPFLQW